MATQTPETRLMEAAFILGQAQRALEEAEKNFHEALAAVGLTEKQQFPVYGHAVALSRS